MTGEDFEDALQYTLRKKGWRLETTKKSGDFGADLIGTDPQGRRVVIQAKRWKQKVGVEAVNQVIAARVYYEAERALIITNHYLTNSAWDLAKKANIEAWTRKRLSNEIQTHE
ncbi:restriction endonuclease [Alicyclobacillus fastidiosus]|uniref:Restriction endonuclease n=1 Tax=Alicyclobacillus fastidiosus TaxID=392011 RepID=A0ABY6ZF28_9BACL|nr:restriction endonuclease [Alicyclobacillus fastidiosus]WAH41443.1 restriction endonuclease [Alicyclobacillus fastidiosus]GMA63075.1 hypothetical protein GCM10025859_35150 [Alicyclobacillus fastidiosus]